MSQAARAAQERAPRVSVARERLLDAAREAFAEKGFDGASIRNITKLLGMRESSFYAHFPSKQAIYDALFDEGGPAVVVHWVSTLRAEDSPEVALRKLANGIMEDWGATRARMLASIVLREVFAGKTEKRAQLLDGIHTAQERLARRMLQWQARGALRSDVPAESLAFSFLAPLSMLRILYFHYASSPEERAQGGALVARQVEAFLTLASSTMTTAA